MVGFKLEINYLSINIHLYQCKVGSFYGCGCGLVERYVMKVLGVYAYYMGRGLAKATLPTLGDCKWFLATLTYRF